MADADKTLSLQVLTPEGEIYKGDVRQVSTRTSVGEIGILPDHAPLVATLKPTTLRIHVDGSETLKFAQAHGLLQVFANEVLMLVEEAIEPGDLDPASLKEDLSDAEERLESADEDSSQRQRAIKDRERIKTFIAVAEES